MPIDGVGCDRKMQFTEVVFGTGSPVRARSAALPRIEEIIEPDSLICPCGCGVMHKIGEDRSERLDIVPAQLRVIVTVRPKYAPRIESLITEDADKKMIMIEGAEHDITVSHPKEVLEAIDDLVKGKSWKA